MADDLHMSGGMDSTRLTSTQVPGEGERRAAQRTAARPNLAALVVERHGGLDALKRDKGAAKEAAREFAELCDALGLRGWYEVPERPPGYCTVCGREMPAYSSTRPSGRQARRDVCPRKACVKAVSGG